MSLARQKDIALLLLKHGRGDLIQETSLYEEAHLADVEIDDDGGPAQLAADLERMGPTFVKLGQLLASRSDIFPPAYIQALERLQDGVAPFSAVEAREVIEADIGARVSTAFAEFEDEPLSAASLAQVHRARMRDGRRVIVKVQRPGIRETIHEDLEALDSLAALAQKHTDLGRRLGLTEMVEQFRRTILRELDFRREARNLEEMAGILEAYPRLVVPRPVMDYSGDRVVTMDYIIGTSVADVSQVAMLDMDRTGAAEDVLRAYLDQILVHGVFHADPHPGNVMLTQDGRIALIDLGMVERFDERRRHELLRLLLAVARHPDGERPRCARFRHQDHRRGEERDGDCLRLLWKHDRENFPARARWRPHHPRDVGIRPALVDSDPPRGRRWSREHNHARRERERALDHSFRLQLPRWLTLEFHDPLQLWSGWPVVVLDRQQRKHHDLLLRHLRAAHAPIASG
jgi:serine/threonine protein kinase